MGKRPSITKEASDDESDPVAAVCTAIEAYFQALRTAENLSLDLCNQLLAPQTASVLKKAERELGMTFPADLKAFLSRGLRAATCAVEEPFASLGFDFLDCGALVKHTRMLRKAADDHLDEDDKHAELIREGVAVTSTEPYLVVTVDGVWHFSFRNPLLQVAPSWAAFLTHWLASGCFCSHSFTSLWRRVGAYVPLKIAPAKNTWLRAYEKQFPQLA